MILLVHIRSGSALSTVVGFIEHLKDAHNIVVEEVDIEWSHDTKTRKV